MRFFGKYLVMAKALLAVFLLIANLVLAKETLAEEKALNCGPFQYVDANLTQAGFALAYMSADSEFKIGTRFYINPEQKAIAVVMVELADGGVNPKACIATIQGNLYVKKDILENLHNKLIGEKT